MKNAIAVKAENLTKTYKLYNSRKDRVKEVFHPFRKLYHKPFDALKNISFAVRQGETFGIIGVNGSGKSTLMQIISGVLTPSSGKFEVNGRVSALLELGAGFNPEFTGMENIYLNGAILGLTAKEMDEKLDAVIKFADIGRFVHQPVKIYSSGMYVRLAFAIAISVEPEILVVDEALAVGDIYFQHKCMHRMKKLMADGVTVIFVSHDMGAVKSLCSRAMLIKRGRQIAMGSAQEVVNRYAYEMMKNESVLAGEMDTDNFGDDPAALTTGRLSVRKGKMPFKTSKTFLARIHQTREGSEDARIRNAELYNAEGLVQSSFFLGDVIRLRVYIEFFAYIKSPNVGFLINDKHGVEVLGTNCSVEKIHLSSQKKGDRLIIDFAFDNVLRQGSYSISIAVGISDEYGRYNLKTLDWVDNAAVLKSEPDCEHHVHSLVKLPVEITLYD